jgi:hypothetical protein
MDGARKPDVLVIHVTDIHVKTAEVLALPDAVKVASAIGAVCEYPARIVLLISGDIAYSGQESQYRIFRDYLGKVVDHLSKHNPISIDICTTPGNHDCNLDLQPVFLRTVSLNGIESAKDAGDFLQLADNLCVVQAPYKAFRDAVSNDLVEFSPVQTRKEFDFEGTKICIDLLNSAWASTKSDEPGQLRFATALLEDVPKADLMLAAIHHPPPWMVPSDRRELQKWLDEHYDYVFCGHEHDQEDVTHTRHHTSEAASTSRILTGNAFHTLDDVESRGFQGFLWDRTADKILIINFIEDGASFKRDTSLGWSERISNGSRNRSAVRVTKAFEEFLDDAGLRFSHPYVNRRLALSDIFVFPEVRKLDLKTIDLGKLTNVVPNEEFIASVLTGPTTVVVGPEQSGKTTLAKVFHRKFCVFGKHPLYLDGADLKSANRGEVTSWINAAKAHQFYGRDLELFETLTPAERVVLLDNIEAVPAGLKGANEVFARAQNLASTVVVFTSNSPLLSVALAGATGDDETEPFWKDADLYELMAFGNARRLDVIRKWVYLGRENSYAEEVLEIESRQVHDFLDNTLGRHGLPKFPVYILLLLQQIEVMRASKGIISSGSQGYLFELVITDSFNRASLSSPINTVMAYLASFARYLVDSDVAHVDQEDFVRFHDTFVKQKIIRVDRESLFRELKEIDVLSDDDRGVGFRYPYYFYYFLARDIAGSIASTGTRALLDTIVEFVHTERSTNVLMFLAHFRHEAEVLNRLIPRAKALFSAHAEAELAENTPLLLRFRTADERRYLIDGPARKVSDRENAARDRDERNAHTRRHEDSNDDPLQVNAAFKLIQVLGQVLKSRAGDLDATVKLEIAETVISLGRRFMTSMYSILGPAADEVVGMLSNAFEDSLKVDKQNAVDIANRLFAFVIASVAIAGCARTAMALSSAELMPLIDQMDKANQNETKRLILLGARLQADRSFPIERIEKLMSSLKTPKELSVTVLRRFVERRLFLNPPDRTLVRSVCNALGLELRSLDGLAKRV